MLSPLRRLPDRLLGFSSVAGTDTYMRSRGKPCQIQGCTRRNGECRKDDGRARCLRLASRRRSSRPRECTSGCALSKVGCSSWLRSRRSKHQGSGTECQDRRKMNHDCDDSATKGAWEIAMSFYFRVGQIANTKRRIYATRSSRALTAGG